MLTETLGKHFIDNILICCGFGDNIKANYFFLEACRLNYIML